jgi:hypothetical protein
MTNIRSYLFYTLSIFIGLVVFDPVLIIQIHTFKGLKPSEFFIEKIFLLSTI